MASKSQGRSNKRTNQRPERCREWEINRKTKSQRCTSVYASKLHTKYPNRLWCTASQWIKCYTNWRETVLGVFGMVCIRFDTFGSHKLRHVRDTHTIDGDWPVCDLCVFKAKSWNERHFPWVKHTLPTLLFDWVRMEWRDAPELWCRFRIIHIRFP